MARELRPRIEQRFEGKREEGLSGRTLKAGSYSFAVWPSASHSGLFAAAVDHDRREIAKEAAREHAHEKLNGW